MNLSVIVLTLNEERNIGECLESVKWADEIIVMDAGSDDRTVEIAKQYTEKVYRQEWLGFSEQRNMALAKASGKWVFFLGADERVSPELRESILRTFAQDSDKTAYAVTLTHFFMDRFLKSYREKKLRLFRNGAVRYCGQVHETPLFEGQTGSSRNASSLSHCLRQYLSAWPRALLGSARETCRLSHARNSSSTGRLRAKRAA